jgi:hypothetical protein
MPRPTFARGAGTFFKLPNPLSQIVHPPQAGRTPICPSSSLVPITSELQTVRLQMATENIAKSDLCLRQCRKLWRRHRSFESEPADLLASR